MAAGAGSRLSLRRVGEPGTPGQRRGGWSLGPSENLLRKVTVHSDKAEPRARSGEGGRGLGTSEWEKPPALQGSGDACR